MTWGGAFGLAVAVGFAVVFWAAERAQDARRRR